MKMWKKCGAGLALLAGLTPALRAQVPPAPPAAPPAAAAVAPRNIWSFICPTQDQKLAWRDKICKSKLGQLLNNGLKPAGFLTGGFIGPFCPGYTQADLAKPADSAEGAAARVKKDEAEAKARRAAVRYLGTVDCHYWPEAQDALVNALRGDRNECVRGEAALALANGCCCTKKTLEALAITVSGSEADGNPAETSERVKAAALGALEGCLARLGCPVPLEAMMAPEPLEKPKDVPPTEKPPGAAADRMTDPLAHYKKIDAQSMEQVIEHARRSVIRCGKTIKASEAALTAQTPLPPVSADGSLLGIINRSLAASKPAVETPVKETKPTPRTESAKHPTSAPLFKPSAEVKPASFQPPVPAPTPPPATNPYPMAVPPPPSSKTPPAAPPRTSSTPPPNQYAMATSAGTLPSITPAGWNPLQERPQLVAPPTPAAAPAMNVIHLIRTLRDAVNPEQREWAAVNLATVSWQTQPQVVDVLLTSARKDPAPTVRVACVRSLGRMGVNHTAAITCLKACQTDHDPRVQQEARRALERLVAGAPR